MNHRVSWLKNIYMAAKKKITTPKEEKRAVAATSTTTLPVKGPHQMVKDNQIVDDPIFTNPGVFSSK